MNQIAEAWAYLIAHWVYIPLCVAVVVFIAGIALMVGIEREENKAKEKLERDRIGKPPSWMK
jgi:hypothetical protein